METLIGRQDELVRLKELIENRSSSFVAVYGRRRVGKTFLIRNAFSSFDFQVTGMANVNTATQLSNFHIALKRYDSPSVDRPLATSWLEAFTQLTSLLESKASEKKNSIPRRTAVARYSWLGFPACLGAFLELMGQRKNGYSLNRLWLGRKLDHQ